MIRDILLSPPVLLAVLGMLVAGARQAYKWTINRGRRQVVDSVSESFVYEIATNHLPHVYDALTRICDKLEITLPDPPPIKFIPSAKVAEDSKPQ